MTIDRKELPASCSALPPAPRSVGDDLAAGVASGMSSSASAVKDGKVIVNFKHTGDAPILRTAKFKVPADAPFHTVTALLRKALGLQVQDPLVCAHRTRAHCRALLSRGRIAGSSSTATAPSRPPRTSSCLT